VSRLLRMFSSLLLVTFLLASFAYGQYQKAPQPIHDLLNAPPTPLVLVAPGSEQLLDIDAELPRDYLKPDLLAVVDKLEPYGEGCRPIVFACRGLEILSLDLVGKNGAQHVRLTLGGLHKWPAIYWNAFERLEKGDFALGDTVDAAFQLSRNTFQGQEKLQLVVVDLVRSAR